MKIYRVNMTNLTCTSEKVPQEWAGLGGRALTSTVVNTEVEPTCHPLGEKNKLVIAPGLLAATPAANSGRLSVGSKSPLTGGIKESNAGGTSAQKLARLGIKAIIIEGQPKDDKFYSLYVDINGVKIAEETEFIGKGNYELFAKLSEKYGNDIGVLSIGQAGEMKLTAANISVKDPEGNIRSAGRGGLGAVMGSKKIKYIAIDEKGGAAPAIINRDAFMAAAKVFATGLKSHPVTGQGLPTYGTNILVNILNEAGGLPTKNFRQGRCEHADLISGEHMYDVITSRNGKPTHGCHRGCVIKCSQHYYDKDGKYVTSGFEYETIWAYGANSLIKDLDIIAQADRICDDIGMDSIEASVGTSVAMEAGIIPWGDGQGALNLLDEVAKGTYLGRIFGNGADFLGRAMGQTRIPTVKRQAIPAYDPRAVKGVGLTYATTPMGADHTAGYSVATNILKVGGDVNPLVKDGNVDLSRNLQIATAAIDSVGLCLFVAFCILDNADAFQAIIDMLNAQYDLTMTADDVTELGKTILRTEREFNKKAGFTKADDRLPEFFREECAPHNTTWDFTDEEIDEVYNF